MDRKTFLLIVATLLLLAFALMFAAAVKAQDPIVYAPVYSQPYYVQPTPVYVPPRRLGVWLPYSRPTYLGQALFGPVYVWAPLVQPVQVQPVQPQPANP